MNETLAAIMSSALLASLSVSGALALSQPAQAQATASPVSSPANAARPKAIALVAAVGDQFQYVRQKESVGSHLEPFTRKTVTAPDQLLNRMVLRGMDRAVSAQYPEAEVVMMTLRPDPPELKILPQDREAHTMGRVMAMLQEYPDRARFDEIMVVTPKWLMSERQGMGSKLSGIGLYVQPLTSITTDIMGDGPIEDEVRDTGEVKKTRSNTYVAPFFYIQITVLDGKTLRVIRKDERYDYRKMINSDSAALDVQASFTPEKLAAEIERFVETAARRLVVDKEGSIDIGPVKSTFAPPSQPK